MTTTATLLERLSEWYDKFKPEVREITVKASRSTVRKVAQPMPGMPGLYYGGRRIRYNGDKAP